MYYDLEYKKRFLAIYALINNKKYEGYDYLFKKIYNIITLENTRKIKIKSFSTDFESALLNAVKNNLRNIRGVGCYFHYCKLIVSHIKKYKLKKIKDFNYNIFLYEITNIPFIKDNQFNYLESVSKKYITINKNYTSFFDYYKKQWVSYIKNGFLNYNNIKKEYRCNSYLENYNRRIKQKISEFLYGNSKYSIS